MTGTHHVAQTHVSPEGITVALIDGRTQQFVGEEFIAWADIIDNGPSGPDDESEAYAWRMFTDAVRPAISESVVTADAVQHPSESIDTDEYHTLDEHDPSVD